MTTDFQIYAGGNVTLQSGENFDNVQLAYKTFGRLAGDRRNVVLVCTPFGGRHLEVEWLVGSGKALDPDRYFIVIVNMIGNGFSSSPSLEPWASRRYFPTVTIYDNVLLQRRLMRDVFAVDHIRLVMGWSMGGQQAYHWGALFPEYVEKIACLCGSAKTARHNLVFLESVRAALQADPAYQDGWFVSKADRGLRAAGLAFASWALSQAFYRQEIDRRMGFESLGDFLATNWIKTFALRDANNLNAMMTTWQRADIAGNPLYSGDFEKALGAIEAEALIMPGETDLYFPVADSEREVSGMRHARLLPIPSIWGHRAGNNPANSEDAMFVHREIAAFLRA